MASALIVSKAVAAIDTVSAFAPGDSTNTGPLTVLTGATRVRTAADLFAIVALGALQTQFGTTVTAYRSATGSTTLSISDPATLLSNRINAAPLSGTMQELKEWMALLSYVGAGLGGSIPSTYSSTTDFTQFGNFGAAVQTRKASYPITSIGQVVNTIATLLGIPRCSSSAPVVAAVTNADYGSGLSAKGTILVWGSGFSSGGNSVVLNRVGSTDSISGNIGSGGYFWDLSPNQINLALPGLIGSGQWTLSVKNACGTSSAAFSITIGT